MDCTVGNGLVLGQRQSVHRAAVAAEVVGEQSAGHHRAHLQSEGLAPGLVYNTAPGVQKLPEKAPELLPTG